MQGRTGQVRAVFAAGACALAALAGSRAEARTYNVTTTSSCSLRLAIQAVNTKTQQGSCLPGDGNADTINVASGTYTFTTSLAISQNLVISGAGIGVTTIRSNMTNDPQLFLIVPVPDGTTFVTLKNMTIDKASGQPNPQVTGIYSYGDATSTSLTTIESCRVAGHTWSGVFGDDTHYRITDSIIESNTTPTIGAGIGVETFNGSSGVFVDNSTINNNVAQGAGGGIYFAGTEQSQITNTTISTNTALQGGGVAYNSPNPSFGYFNLISTTVTRNMASQTGGGVYTPPFDGSYDPNFQISGSIVAGNVAHVLQDWDGHVHTATSSCIGDTLGVSDIHVDQGGNLYDVDPLLDFTLRDMGGPVHAKVHRLLPGSPVIDVMSFNGLDERHVARPQLGRTDGALADMGAYEETRQETEILTVAAKSNVTHAVVTATQYSAGKGTNLQSNAANQFVTYQTSALLPSGTYKVAIGFKKGSNAGRFQFAVSSSVNGTFTNLGAVQDGFSSSSSWVTVTLPNVTFGSSSTKFLRFTVTGKNLSSSGFQIFPDYVELTRQ